MSLVKKQARKNREHQKLLGNERFSTFIAVLAFIPFFINLAIEAYSVEDFSLLIIPIDSFLLLAYGLVVAALGDVMMFPRWLKLLGMFLIQSWLAYFWFALHQSRWAFIPIVPVFLILMMQGPKISKKAFEDQA